VTEGRPRIVVTGGAGFLGRWVERRLAESGADVVAVDRVARRDEPPGQPSVVGDVRDPDLLRAVLAGADAVVHAAFAPPQASARELREVNVDAVRSLAAHATQQAVRRLVIVSSTIVERTPRRHFVSAAPLSRLDDYRVTRIEGEDAALAANEHLSVAVARPATFLGPGRVGAFALLFEAVRSGAVVPLLGPGTNRYSLLHVADLADGLARLALGDTRGVVHFGGTEVPTAREQLQRLIDHARSGSRLMVVPRRIGLTAARTLELAGLPPLSDWHHATARSEDRLVDISVARRELDWEPRYTTTEALFDAYDWYSSSRATGRPTPTTHPVPRSHRIITAGLRTLNRARR
jgi:nucleoside-diphosphate-sugar epimerase